MNDNISHQNIRFTASAIMGEKKARILSEWIKKTGIPYKRSELLEAVTSRKPVYHHEGLTKEMEETAERLNHLYQKMEAASLIADQNRRQILLKEGHVFKDDTISYIESLFHIEESFRLFKEEYLKAENILTATNDTSIEETYTLEGIVSMSGETVGMFIPRKNARDKFRLMNRPFRLIRISAWKNFHHKVSCIMDSALILMDIISCETAHTLESLSDLLPGREYDHLKAHLEKLEMLTASLIWSNTSSTSIIIPYDHHHQPKRDTWKGQPGVQPREGPPSGRHHHPIPGHQDFP